MDDRVEDSEAVDASHWAELVTEQRNPKSSNLDELPSEEVVRLLLEEDRHGIDQSLQATKSIDQAAMWFADVYLHGGTVLFAGAGTSGRLGVLEAAECPPTFNTDPERIRAVIAGGPDAVFRSKEGAEDIEGDGRAAAEELDEGDMLVGLSASSVTPFVRGALDQARASQVSTILITCAAPQGLDHLADVVIALETGAEVLTGSTRLKAGSATKAVLNAMTTAAMVRLGKVYGNFMVDVQPSCSKLEDRALRIVMELAQVPADTAAELLESTGGRVKEAVVVGLLGVSRDDAFRRLDLAKGNLRRALRP